MSRSSTRLRSSGLAATLGAALLATTAVAGPARAADPPTALSYSGTASTSNVSLDLTLPGGNALAGPLGSVFTQAGLADPFDADGTLSLSLLTAAADLQHSATHAVPEIDTTWATTATGTIGSLLTALQSSLKLPLDPTASATLSSPGTHVSPELLGSAYGQLPAVVQQLLTLSVPAITETSDTDPMTTTGRGRIATVDLGSIGDALPAAVLTPLTSALTSALDETTTLFGTGGDSLAGVLGQLLTTLHLSTAQTSALLTEASSLEQELETEIPAALTAIESGSLVTLNGLASTDTLTTDGATEVSTVKNQLAGISILGGLVQVHGFSNGITTEAGSKTGSAAVVATPDVATASVGTDDELTAAIGQAVTLGGTVSSLVDTLTGGLGLVDLTPLTSGLTTLQSDLSAATAAAGIQVVPDHVVTQSAAADGSAASGSLSGLQIVIDPLAGLPTGGTLSSSAVHPAAAHATTAPLLSLDVGGASASSTARLAAATTTGTTTGKSGGGTVSTVGTSKAGGTSPAAPATGSSPSGTLAFTGADLPVIGGIALALLAGAYLLRRRRLVDRDL